MKKDDNILFERINLFALGNAAVGKTSCIFRFCQNQFKEDYLTTVGIDFMAKNVPLPNNRTTKICFYDTAGEEKFRAISFNLIKTADGILLMYDITCKNSFKAIPGWIDSIKQSKGEDFPIVLIGNKCDLEGKREVLKEEGEEVAQQNNLHFFETSNKDGINVDEAIMDLITIIVEKNDKKKKNEDNKIIKLENKIKEKKNKGCC